MLITDDYIEQNQRLHNIKHTYGNGGRQWAGKVLQVALSLKARCGNVSILDYGCGKGSLKVALDGYDVRNYDPALPAFSASPEPADLVVCTDVMEHIEPECLYEVLKHIKYLTKHKAFFVIATREAKKTLPDGRNAHLIVADADWWRTTLDTYFDLTEMPWGKDGEVVFVAEAL